jgi:hypothetical protein
MYQVHKHKTEPRRFFIWRTNKGRRRAPEAHRAAYLQFAKKDLPRVADRTEGICSSHWAEQAWSLLDPAGQIRPSPTLLFTAISTPPNA